jgi:hypothetical protein
VGVGEEESVYINMKRRRRLTPARPAYLARLLPESGQTIMPVIDCTKATAIASEAD